MTRFATAAAVLSAIWCTASLVAAQPADPEPGSSADPDTGAADDDWSPVDASDDGEPPTPDPDAATGDGGAPATDPVPAEGVPASEGKPNWGTSHELDTQSPWQQKSPTWQPSSETVSPWGQGAPRDVPARFDVRLGETSPDRRGYEPMVRRGIYDRPYLARFGGDSSAIAIGGYFDFVMGYQRDEGVSEGLQFESRRFNIFLTSRIADRVRLTSELEFEHGTEEIALETAAVDILFHHTINLRGGVILVPLGKFNIAHDAPLYDIIDRPLVSTQIIPATLSEPGIGFFGAFYPGGGNRLTYEVYITGGLQDGVIAPEGTRLSEGKADEIFSEDNNGVPAVSGRLAYLSPTSKTVQGEIGASFYAGIYNKFTADGEDIDAARWLRVAALDAELALWRVTVRGEVAYANINVPDALTSRHARSQVGFYAETIVNIVQNGVGFFEQGVLAAAARFDLIDLNLDKLDGTGQPIGGATRRLSIGPSFRPVPGTALRLVYHHDWISDELENPIRNGGIQLGLATYF